MATYKEIKGDTVEVVTSDPTNPGEGDIWYNSTTGVLKGFTLTAAAWASGGNLNLARRAMGSAGTQTAGLGFGGTPPPNGQVNSEEYNGSSWSEGNNLGTGRTTLAGAGTQTAGLGFGGGYPVPSLGTANNQQAGTGLQSSALSIGGSSPLTATEEFTGETITQVAKTLSSS